MNQRISFDLTEVLLAVKGTRRYYGIVRVVAEIANALVRKGTRVRFCVHSPAFDCFFEIQPRLTSDGLIDLNVPTGSRQFTLRRSYYRQNRLRDFLLPAISLLIHRYNRTAWRLRGIDLTPLDMSGTTLITCSRPKLIVEAIATLERQFSNYRVVSMLHDMMPLHDFGGRAGSAFPENFIGDNTFVIKKSDFLLAVSNFTKSEIHSFAEKGTLPTPPPVHAVPLVHECPLGDDERVQPIPADPYILTVGSTLGRKNLNIVFEAMLHLQRSGKIVPTLCLAGSFRKRLKTHIEAARFDSIRDRIFIAPSPNQTDLVELYKHARALIMPSRMEGWGLPAGEALWFGTPAICSTAPVLREVCGELGLYFDPDDASQLAEKIDYVMQPANARKLRERIANAHSNLRRWSDVASDLLSVLENEAGDAVGAASLRGGDRWSDSRIGTRVQ